MSIILYTILILFLIKIVRDSLFCVWLWQVKEYRIDRTVSYLKEDRQIIKNNIFYLAALFLILAFYFSQQVFIYLALLFFAFTFYQILTEINSRILKRPKLTFRILATFLTIIVFYLIGVFYWIPAFAGMTRPSVLI
jgi:hypothetical protein